MPKELHSMHPVTGQMVLSKLGAWCSERLNVDTYFLIEAVYLMIADFGDKKVKKLYENEYGENTWKKTLKKLDFLNMKISGNKVFYDAITDKSFNKKEPNMVQQLFKKQFLKNGSKVALMQRELYRVFLFLVSNSTIQRHTIRPEHLKVNEQKDFRKVEVNPKRSSNDTQ